MRRTVRPSRRRSRPGHLVAVDPGKADVHERDLRRGRDDELHPGHPVGRFMHLMALELEDGAQHLPGVPIVLDDGDAERGPGRIILRDVGPGFPGLA